MPNNLRLCRVLYSVLFLVLRILLRPKVKKLLHPTKHRKNFTKQLTRRSTECKSFRRVSNLLCEAKIHKLYVSVRCEHQILRLQVSINNSTSVKILERFQYTSDNELCCCLIKSSLIPQDCPYFTSQARLEKEVNVLCITKGSVQATHEGTIGTC